MRCDLYICWCYRCYTLLKSSDHQKIGTFITRTRCHRTVNPEVRMGARGDDDPLSPHTPAEIPQGISTFFREEKLMLDGFPGGFTTLVFSSRMVSGSFDPKTTMILPVQRMQEPRPFKSKAMKSGPKHQLFSRETTICHD